MITQSQSTRFKITIMFMLMACFEARSQQEDSDASWLQKHPIEIAFGKFGVGLPFTNVFNRAYTMLSVGTEFKYRSKKHFELLQTVKFNHYATRYNTSGLVLNSELLFRYKTPIGLMIDAGLGIGYSHRFRPRALYKFQNGDYVKVTDYGKPGVMTDFVVTAAYGFKTSRDSQPFHVFCRYGNYVELFYNPDIPALPQNILQGGVRFYIQ